LIAQVTGVVAVGVFVFAVSAIFWLILKGIVGLRVSGDEEIEGLDIGEHGISAYPDFPSVTSVLGHGTPGRAAGEYAGR
jgi:Amt family ammonium transporter